ncbi:MAG: ATPase, T2SS/T4P/T4SS family [Candidatus Micrarchaeota archaeon]
MGHPGWEFTCAGGAQYCAGESLRLSQAESEVLAAALKIHLEAGDGEKSRGTHWALLQACKARRLALGRERASAVETAMEMALCGTGILGKLIEDDAIEEISVIGANKPVRVYLRGRGWRLTDVALTSEEFAVSAVNRLARPLGRRLTYSTPRLNAAMGRMRIHASMPPASREIEITIRKFTAEPFSMPSLIRCGMISARAAAFLWLVAAADSSVLIAGNTGSGKTTLLNAIFSFVPAQERVIAIEETPEMQVPQEHCVRLLASEKLGISMQSLVQDSLRMRPDRVAIGEVRTPQETRALMDSLLSGQAKAAYATFHANSAAEALTRLAALGALESELDSIKCIVVCRRATLLGGKASGKGATEERKVTEIAEVAQGKAVSLYTADGSMLKPTKALNSSKLLSSLEANYGRGRRWMLEEIRERADFLGKLAAKPIPYREANKAIWERKEALPGD